MRLLSRYRVVIDTNVFVSGVLFGGIPEKILRKFLDKKFDLLISPELLSEILRKLILFELDNEGVEGWKEIFEEGAEKILIKNKVKLCRDEKDNMLLELSYGGRADFLVTGDKDLLTIEEFKGTKILKPREFLDNLV